MSMASTRPARAEEVLSQARRVLLQRVRRGATMSSPQAVKDYLQLEIGALEHEVFCVLFLDAQHRIIEQAADRLKAPSWASPANTNNWLRR